MPRHFDVDSHRKQPSPVVGIVFFLLFASAGVAILAAVVLLPEYALLKGIEARRGALAHQVECERRLAVYNDRLIEATETDPILTARLMIRRANYQLPGAQAIDVADGTDPAAAPMRILREANATPQPPDDALLRAGRWIDDGPTKTALVAIALGLIAVGAVLFAPVPRREG